MGYMQESLALQAQDSTLQQMGLAHEAFDKRPAEQKDAVQKEIAQRMKGESQAGGTQNAEGSSVTATAA